MIYENLCFCSGAFFNNSLREHLFFFFFLIKLNHFLVARIKKEKDKEIICSKNQSHCCEDNLREKTEPKMHTYIVHPPSNQPKKELEWERGNHNNTNNNNNSLAMKRRKKNSTSVRHIVFSIEYHISAQYTHFTWLTGFASCVW